MSIQQKIKNLIDLQSSPFDVDHIIAVMKSLGKLGPAQINANRSQIQDGLKIGIGNLVKTISDNYKQISEGWHQPLQKELLSFMKWNPIIPLSSQIKGVNQLIERGKRQVNSIRVNNAIENKRIEDAVNRAANQQMSLAIDLKQANPYVLAPRQFTGIQEQVQPIKKFLQVGIPAPLSAPQTIPKSIRFLDEFTKLQGYEGLGTVSQKPGRTYLGRYTVKEGNQVYTFQYPKNKIPHGESPNITQNFKYFANNAVNKWNGFVQAENNLIQFVQKVQTKQKRKQYVQEQLKGLTKATFAAMALSSITYYYLQIPMQTFAKFNLNKYDGTVTSFLNSYKVGVTVSRNPFLLTDEQGKQILQILLKKNMTPVTLAQEIAKKLQGIRNPVNSPKIKQFTKFVADKVFEAVNYFNSAGIPEETFIKKLDSGLIDKNLKMKKFILPSPFQNTEILEILSKVNKTKDQNQQKYWNIQWGGQNLACHDYIWNYDVS